MFYVFIMLSGGYCLGLFRDCKQIVGDCFDYLGTLKIGPEEWQVSFLVIGVFGYRSFLVLGIILIHDVNPLQLDRRGPVVHLADLAKTVVVKKVVARSIIALAARRSPLVVK